MQYVTFRKASLFSAHRNVAFAERPPGWELTVGGIQRGKTWNTHASPEDRLLTRRCRLITVSYRWPRGLVTFLYYSWAMRDEYVRPAKTIRLREDVYQRARVAAVTSRKTIGQWIEEAILEKDQREAAEPGRNSDG